MKIHMGLTMQLMNCNQFCIILGGGSRAIIELIRKRVGEEEGQEAVRASSVISHHECSYENS